MGRLVVISRVRSILFRLIMKLVNIAMLITLLMTHPS